MITTVSKIKDILKFTDSTYDSYITTMLPILSRFVVDYCNNDFLNCEFDYINSASISFVNSDSSINKTNISDADLVAGDIIRVYGSLRNDDMYRISSISGDKIIVDEDIIKDESAGQSVYIATVAFPRSLELTIAEMIKYKIERESVSVINEKIDDYSVTYLTANEFPGSAISGLNRFRRLYRYDIHDL